MSRGDVIDELLGSWRYSVPLINRQTGERQTVMVKLDQDEQVHALMAWLENPEGSGGPDGCIANYHITHHALKGLSDDWEISYPEIMRIRNLH